MTEIALNLLLGIAVLFGVVALAAGCLAYTFECVTHLLDRYDLWKETRRAR